MRGAGGVGGIVTTETLTASGVILKTSYPAYDGNGNVTAVVENIGNTATVVATYRYDAYGQLIATTGDPSKSAYRFSTKPYDELTGLYYYGYRYYDPVTGRWPSRDPIGEEGGTNLHGMVGNDAVNRLDVLGLKFKKGRAVNVKCPKGLREPGSKQKSAGTLDVIDYSHSTGGIKDLILFNLDGSVRGRQRGVLIKLHLKFTKTDCCCKGGDIQWHQIIVEDNDPSQVDARGNMKPVPRPDVGLSPHQGNVFKDTPTVPETSFFNRKKIRVKFHLILQCKKDGIVTEIDSFGWGGVFSKGGDKIKLL